MVEKHFMKMLEKDRLINSRDFRLLDHLNEDDYDLSGYYVIEVARKKTICRGYPFKLPNCTKTIKKGEIRFVVNYSGPFRSVPHFFCRTCTADMVDEEALFDLTNKWWDKNGWIKISELVNNKDTDSLINFLNDSKRRTLKWWNNANIDSYNSFFSKSEIKKFTHKQVRDIIIDELGNLGSIKSLKPIAKMINKNDFEIITNAIIKIIKRNKTKELAEVLKFLQNKDDGVKRMGVSMLKGITL